MRGAWFPTTLRANFFLAVAAAIALAAVALGVVPWRTIPEVEDVRLLTVLAALVLSVGLVRASGALDFAVRRAIRRFSRARTLTAALVVASGALSAVVTNDVALFVIVPFTVAAARYSDFRVRNAVILEVTAANLLGCVSPIGNPQNIFLLHRSGMSIGRFFVVMAPFGLVAAGVLAGAILILEPARSVQPVERPVPTVAPAPAAAGIAGIVLVLASIGGVLAPGIALGVAGAAWLAFPKHRGDSSSLAIVPLFFFVFIDMAAIAALRFSDVYARLPLPPGPRLYAAGALFSEAISNVPAAVLLAPSAGGLWKTLLYAVNVGGCGTLVASLANLLGWQIYVHERGPDPVYLGRFYRVSFAFLGILSVAVFLLI
ncbi:MAG TPA: SLC13 family permease [Thermoanaerobaculia bacterium]|nr:SLC13 family permease [Thermoanaerobaculia bacterium]